MTSSWIWHTILETFLDPGPGIRLDLWLWHDGTMLPKARGLCRFCLWLLCGLLSSRRLCWLHCRCEHRRRCGTQLLLGVRSEWDSRKGKRPSMWPIKESVKTTPTIPMNNHINEVKTTVYGTITFWGNRRTMSRRILPTWLLSSTVFNS